MAEDRQLINLQYPTLVAQSWYRKFGNRKAREAEWHKPDSCPYYPSFFSNCHPFPLSNSNQFPLVREAEGRQNPAQDSTSLLLRIKMEISQPPPLVCLERLSGSGVGDLFHEMLLIEQALGELDLWRVEDPSCSGQMANGGCIGVDEILMTSPNKQIRLVKQYRGRIGCYSRSDTRNVNNGTGLARLALRLASLVPSRWSNHDDGIICEWVNVHHRLISLLIC